MKPLPWFLLIIPIAYAFPTNDDKIVLATSASPFDNGSLPLILPQRTTLEDLLKQFNIQDAENQHPGRAKRSSCVIPPGLLRTLAEQIRNIANYFPKPEDPAYTPKEPLALNLPETASACDKAKVKLLMNVDQLTNYYLIMLINGTRLNDDEFNRVKKLFDDLNTSIKDDIQTIKEGIDDETKAGIDEVLNEKYALEVRLVRVIKDLEYNITIKKKLRDNMMDLVVSEVDRGKYDSAVAKFLELGNAGLVFEVADKMDQKPNNENYLSFVKELPWLMHRMFGYQAMLRKGKLGLSIFTLEKDFKEVLEQSNDPRVVAEIQHDIDDVRRNMEKQVTEMVNKMAQRIGTETYNDIIQYSKDHQKAFDVHIEDIVQRIYENSDSNINEMEKILDFSDALTIIAQSGQVYMKLYKLMVENQDLPFPAVVKIAFKLRELMVMENYHNTPENIKTEMEATKEIFPQVIKSIVWGQVCIKNEDLNAYLHSKEPYDSSRTTIILSPTKADLWEIDSNDNVNSFKIFNTVSRKYLYVENDEFSFSTYKRRIFEWRRDAEQLFNHVWLFEDIKWQDGKFLIKNKDRNEYLNGERLEEQKETDKEIEAALAILTAKSGPLAASIQQLVQSHTKRDSLQVFSWGRRSRGRNPNWIIMDSSKCN